MPDASIVLTALRDELELAGLIRRPDNAGALPPAFVEPDDDAPAPGDREAPEDDTTLVVTIRLSGELSEPPFSSYRRRVVADVVYRSRTTRGLIRARALDAAIRARIVEQHDNAAGFMLGQGAAHATMVLQAGVYAGLSPVSNVNGTRTDRAAYVLEVLAS